MPCQVTRSGDQVITDRLHAFCRNYLTTSLPTYNVNEKYPAFPNGESLKSMKLVLLYQAIISPLPILLVWQYILIKIYSLFYPHISLERHHYIPCPLEFYLPIDGLYAFCRNYLTTSLPIYDVNEKYPTYMPVIFHCCCCSKLVSTFCGVAHYGVSYCQRVFMGSMHFVTIASQLPYLLMT